MEAGRLLYNATLCEALHRHSLLKQSKDWLRVRTIRDKKARAVEFNRLSKEAGCSPVAMITFARKCKNEAGWKHRLGSNVTPRWHALGNGSGVVQRDVCSAFLARCVIESPHHQPHLEMMWAAQKPVLLQTGWLRDEPAKIELSGKITVVIPSEPVVCRR